MAQTHGVQIEVERNVGLGDQEPRVGMAYRQSGCEIQRGADAVPGVLERRIQPRRVVEHAHGKRQQRVVERAFLHRFRPQQRVGRGASRVGRCLRNAFLDDMFLLGRDAHVGAPDSRELAIEHGSEGRRRLIVGVEVLLECADRELQRLVTMTELGQSVLHARVIAHAGGRAAPQIDHGCGEGQRVRLAGSVAVGPGETGAAAEVAGIGSVDAGGVLLAFAHLESYRYGAVLIGLVSQGHADGRKDAQTQQIVPRLFDLARSIVIAGVHQQTLTYEGFPHELQSPEADPPDLDSRAGDCMESDIEHAFGGVLVGHGRVDFGECIAAIL